MAVSSSLASFIAPAQAPHTAFQGKAVFDRLVAQAEREAWTRLPIGELIGKLAIALLGTPYAAHTLELDDSIEVCVINLEGLDCVTLFECCLNLARILKQGHRTQSAFLAAVRQTRYRNGIQGDYTSRLHYTTDWIWDNARKGVVTDITPTLPGAEAFTQKVGYMSAHPEAYRQLKANPRLVPAIRAMEKRVNAHSTLFVPMSRVAEAEPLLRTGDIVGITTSRVGIDVSHTGLCYRDSGGVLRFLNASSAPSKMKVSLDGRLSEAITWSKRNTGIVVARPLESATIAR